MGLILVDPQVATMNTASGFNLRAATTTDIPGLVETINAAFAVETFLEGTRTNLEHLSAAIEVGSFLLMEDASGRLLGSVYTEVRGPRGYMGMLSVAPEHQGSGLGRTLIEAAEAHLRQQGCEVVDITVLNLRPELPPLYGRFGYVRTGIEAFARPDAIKPGVECHCIVMTKTL